MLAFLGGTQLQTTGGKMEEVSVKPVEEAHRSEDTSDYQSANGSYLTVYIHVLSNRGTKCI